MFGVMGILVGGMPGLEEGALFFRRIAPFFLLSCFSQEWWGWGVFQLL